ncbi:hypothetical protein ACET65_07885 [Aeromonas rivipollensis]
MAVDVRAGSPTQGQWVGMQLSAEDGAPWVCPWLLCTERMDSCAV